MGRDYTASMVRGRRAGVAAALAVVAAAAVTAGCGGGSTSSALSLDPVAAAATKSQSAGAARVRLSIAVTGPQGKTFRLRGTGAIDGPSSDLTFKLGSLLGQAGVPSAALTQLAHGSLREITLEQDGDYVIYVRLGSLLSSQLPGGQQWIKLDLSKLGKSAGLDLSKLLAGSQMQPGDLLLLLRTEGAKIHKVGSATINGATTTHYRVVVDTRSRLKELGTSPLLAGVAAQMPSIPEDVWIGKDGLVRRVRASFDLPHGATPVGMAMALDLYDYGAQVDIAAPPSSQVFDATDLAQQGLGGLH
jgi:hypothetical protein